MVYEQLTAISTALQLKCVYVKGYDGLAAYGGNGDLCPRNTVLGERCSSYLLQCQDRDYLSRSTFLSCIFL